MGNEGSREFHVHLCTLTLSILSVIVSYVVNSEQFQHWNVKKGGKKKKTWNEAEEFVVEPIKIIMFRARENPTTDHLVHASKHFPANRQ